MWIRNVRVYRTIYYCMYVWGWYQRLACYHHHMVARLMLWEFPHAALRSRLGAQLASSALAARSPLARYRLASKATGHVLRARQQRQGNNSG